MPQTYTDRSPMDLCLLTRSYPPRGSFERVMEGDIVAVRRPRPGDGFGANEAKTRLWVRVEGWDRSRYGALTRPMLGSKRRYSVPLARLLSVAPWLDLARVRDVADSYQPFLPVSAGLEWFPHRGHKQLELATGFHMTELARLPLRVNGLIFDKQTGLYLTQD